MTLSMLWLLAVRESGWRSEYWPTDNTTVPLHLLGYIVLGLGVVLACYAAVVFGQRLRTRTKPFRVYLTIAGRVGLDLPDRIWLWKVARRENLRTAITLLLSDRTMRHYTHQYSRRLSGQAAQIALSRAEAIRSAVFDLPEAPEDTAEPYE